MAKSRVMRRVRELFVGHKGRRLNEFGQEMPDPTPMAPPVGFVPRDSLADQIRQMVRGERLRNEAIAAGMESFDEADDFDIPDDRPDPSTPYEGDFEGGQVKELRARQDADMRKRAAAAKAASSSSPASAVGAPKGKKSPDLGDVLSDVSDEPE